MTIKYLNDSKPSEDGFYLVNVNGQLTVAEFSYIDDDSFNWSQLGIDYDVWQYSDRAFEINVIRKLDLEELAKHDS